jgi:hypothetical protein
LSRLPASPPTQIGSSPPAPPPQPPGGLRYGYFVGGDRESVTRLDLRRAAGFVRHGDAHVTNCLLPLQSMEMEWRSEMPCVEEHRQMEPLVL